jgi:hypothetical protein
MKKFNTFLLAVISICSYQLSTAQTGTLCGGNKGPNLLGSRGTFSAPFITNNTNAAACLQSGSNSYNPNGNVGNQLEGCSAPSGNIFPCSDYKYTAQSDGMLPEFTYSLLKVMGDASGSNCIHAPIWTAKDHTGGDGSYFMAVNGAPNKGYSPIFYQIKNIPVCTNATYELSAWVINMMPAKPTTDGAAPNISFVVNGDTIGKSGPIPYDNQWHKVGGQFTATSEIVNLQVINATQIAGGNDLGLDDISINVCESRIVVDGPNVITEGNTVSPQFTITDNTQRNTWYKWELSSDGGITFNDITNGNQATFVNGQYKMGYEIDNVVNKMNGYTYRLVVSTSQTGLANPDCIFFNDYTLRVASGAPLPIQLSSFDAKYSDGVATLKWQTSQELNNDRFELFRSFDGNDFELAATVAGAGTSYTAKSYSYQDHIVSSGNSVFYKLKQIDKNGKFSFSSVIKLSLSATTSSFQLFPNPVVNNFTASFTAPRTTTATLLIRNSNGQTVYSKSINVVKGSNAIPVNNVPLTTGMYYVTIANDDFNFTGKLQKR